MILIVDGYNVLKKRTGKHVSESVRNAFITQIAAYAVLKKHSCIVVFDAGPFVTEHHVRIGTVQVIYAGQKQTADTCIIRLIQQHAGRDVLVVTDDRAICSVAYEHDIPSLGSTDFYDLLNQSSDTKQQVQRPLRKLHGEAQEIDAFMQEVSGQVEHKPEEQTARLRKKRAVSKTERKLGRVARKV